MRLDLSVPLSPAPGSLFSARLALGADVAAGAIHARLIGRDRVKHARIQRELELVSLDTQVRKQRAGLYACELELPADLPPTYRGTVASTTWMLEVSIDGARARHSHDVKIWRRAEPPRAAEPLVVEQPGAGLGLASAVVQTGGVLRGVVAARGDVLELSLTPVHVIERGDGCTAVKGAAHRFRVAAGELELALPPLAPTQGSRLWRLEWRLALCAGRRVLLETPITICDGEVAISSAPPAIGKARVADELGMRLVGAELRADVGDVGVRVIEIEIGRSVRAELAFPALGIELKRGPSGREPAQARAFWELWFEPLQAWAGDALGKLRFVELTDSRIVGEGPLALRELAEIALVLARRLPTARAAIPPPTAFAPGLAAWRALAHELGGPLDTARMQIRGAIDGQAAQIVTDHAAGVTRIALAPDPPLGPELPPSVLQELEGLGAKLEGGAISSSIPGFLPDPQPARRALHALAATVRGHRARGGPYR
jgi:hypothetical protein